MKVLFSIDDPFSAPNPYVATLIRGMQNLDCELQIDYGVKNFWDSSIHYDIIHVMWPNCLLYADGKKYDTDELLIRCQELRNHNILIVSTCHNLVPHYDNDPEHVKAYDIIYTNSCAIFHLGTYSLELFRKKYPQAHQYLLGHHVYDEIYTFTPSMLQSRRKLGLKPNGKYILCFGAFRSDEERQLIGKLSVQLSSQSVRVITPCFYQIPKRRNLLAISPQIGKALYYRCIYPKLLCRKYFNIIPDSVLPYYFSASDIVLIQRKEILNSGNLPMAFYFGKVVVGPKVGNVGSILSETGNPTFNVSSLPDSLYDAVMKGFELSKLNLGQENKKITIKYTTAKVSEALYHYYLTILDKKDKSF